MLVRLVRHTKVFKNHFNGTISSYNFSKNNLYNKEIVIVGGGTGGLAIGSAFQSEHNVTVIEPNEYHYYQPMWTLVGGGIKKAEDSKKNTENVLPDRCNWKKQKAKTFNPSLNYLTLEDGEKINYDYLVMATGLKIDYDGIEGLKEALEMDDSFVCTNYGYDTCQKTAKYVKEFNGGDAIFTFPNFPIKCAGAPQKIMYLAEESWRKKQIRDKTNVFFNSAAGAQFAVKKYADSLSNLCDLKNITRNYGLNLIKVDGKKKEATFAVNKEIYNTHEIKTENENLTIKFDFLHAVPKMGPCDEVKQSDLSNDDGYVEVNKETLQHVKYPNVFALGDCSNTPNSKTAAAIAAQNGVLAENLKSHINGQPLTAIYDGYSSCPIPVGDDKLILAEFDYNLTPQETLPFDQAIPSQAAYQLKSNLMPLLYWNSLLQGRWHGPKKIRKFFNPFRIFFGKKE